MSPMLKSRWLLVPVLLTSLLLILAAACDDEEETAGGTTPTGGASPTAAASPTEAPRGPTVDILTPEDGGTVAAGGVEVAVAPSGFEVVDKLGQPAAANQGHVHFYLDVAEIPTTPGRPAVTAEGTYHASAMTSYTWPDVPAGEHTFAAQLVNNDHTPLEPPVTAEVTVTAE